jgi:hypothetical protein
MFDAFIIRQIREEEERRRRDSERPHLEMPLPSREPRPEMDAGHEEAASDRGVTIIERDGEE